MGNKRVGILTAGGDAPGLNAAIRGFGRTAIGEYGMKLIGFQNGFRGLALDKHIELNSDSLSGILTVGGTILGTSRDKVHRLNLDGRERDMTGEIAKVYDRNKLDALVTLGGGGTAKNALRLQKAGLNVVHLPKTMWFRGSGQSPRPAGCIPQKTRKHEIYPCCDYVCAYRLTPAACRFSPAFRIPRKPP